MRLRYCLTCCAIVGLCVHTAHEPMARLDHDPPPPNPVQFVINAPAVSASTTSAIARGHVPPPPSQFWSAWFTDNDAAWAVQHIYEQRRRQVAAIL